MRQAGGYGGPVAHWWQNRYRYAGPGRDWRYEGILIAYSELFLKTTNDCYRLRLLRAIHDLSEAQSEQGHFAASKFEINPGTVGTPHEAAASLGLLEASQAIKSQEALSVAKRNLDALIAALWDEKGQGFNDSLTARGRVPNKLATFAQALFKCFELSKEEKYLNYARAAIDDVLAFQVDQGSNAGAIHQYAADAQSGDKRFFPYYNARCIPPLVIAAKVLNEAKYHDAAVRALTFIEKQRLDDGSWPQIVYDGGKKANWPRWNAGAADILLAYHVLEEKLPEQSLNRLLDSQLASGGFTTAYGLT